MFLTPFEEAILALIAGHSGKAGGAAGKKGIYWGATAGTGVGGVGGVNGGSSVSVEVRILPNGGVNTNADNIKDKKVVVGDDRIITTVMNNNGVTTTVTTPTAVADTANSGERVDLPKNGGIVYIPTLTGVNTDIKYDNKKNVYGQPLVTSTTTIHFSDGSNMVIRSAEFIYGGTRSVSSLQFLGVEDAYIESIRLQDTSRVERERFELIDALRDGRMRVIQTGTGAQYLNYKEGTDGDDVLSGGGILNGLGGNDVLNGANNPYDVDVLDGGDGNDTLNGGEGMDILVGGAGADRLNGGDGFDIASYAPASGAVVVNMFDVSHNTGDAAGDGYASIEGIVGSEHNDKITGNNYGNRLEGGGGNDTIDGSGGGDDLYGNDGDDFLIGGSGADTFEGGDGRDTVSYHKNLTAVQIYLSSMRDNVGAYGDTYEDIEVIDGTRFDDVIEGDPYENTFWGDAGNDTLNGAGGSDTLAGGDGDDKLEGGWGSWGDRLDGGNGRDTASYYHAQSGVQVYLWDLSQNTGEAAGDIYVSIEVIDGSTHSDKLEGNASTNTFWGDAGHDVIKGLGGADTLSGGAGGDHLLGGEGADRLDGGADFDFASYADASSGVLVDLLNTTRNTGEAAGDVYISIEGLIGSAHSDQFYGTGGWNGFYGGCGDDQLEGRGGGDQLDGGDGADTISGGEGFDWLLGNAGADQFQIDTNPWSGGAAGGTSTSPQNVDTLADFNVGEGDRIALNTSKFWGQGPNESIVYAFSPVAAGSYASLQTSVFAIGAQATSSSHRIIYDQASGSIYFDADGAGRMNDQILFAKVAAGTALTAAHFQLFTI